MGNSAAMVTSPASAPPDTSGYGSSLFKMYVDPAGAFTGIVAKPRVLIPLVAFVLLHTLFTLVWLDRVNLFQYARAQVEESGQTAPAAASDEQDYGFFKVTIGASSIAMAPVMILAVAGVLFVAFTFFAGADLDFKTVFSITTWSLLSISMITTPATLVILFVTGDWSRDPQSLLMTDASYLVTRESVSRYVYMLLQSLDLFSIWTASLIAVGMSKATRMSLKGCAIAIVALWALYVLMKIAFVSLLRG
jgi:hypothetical protein